MKENMEKLFVNEQDKKPATKVEILAPNGLGFGEGSINAALHIL
jgi:hypothetical protein